jgi:NAD(P)-dependent dehydrogenase (short-subunit alcohol dehydrogenase family)
VVGPASELTDAIVERLQSSTAPPPIGRAVLDDPTAADAGPVDVLVIDATEELDVDALRADGGDVGSAIGRLAEALSWCQAVGRRMCDRRKGVIVIVGTTDGYHSQSGGSIRSTVGGGLLGMVRGLGIEWAPFGVRVVGVAYSRPVGTGATRTPPIGRHPTTAEVADAVEFMAGADASYIVAETLRVDGGYVAYQMF